MHVYVKIDNKELLKTLDDIEGVEVVDVERELTEKEKLDKENHALRRAWKPSRWGSISTDIVVYVVNVYL